MRKTGTGGLPHLNDEKGKLWEQFGATGRSTFFFVNQDGTYRRTEYGQMNQKRLESLVQELMAS